MGDVTVILNAVQRGEKRATEQLLPLVYDELRHLAARRLYREPQGQTLQATALVHEAYLRLVGSPSRRWEGRKHFFNAAAEAMRRILVDRARKKRSLKGGGQLVREELTESKIQVQVPDDQLLGVDEALDRLAMEDPVAADLVKLRYYVGMTMPETSEALQIPLRSAERIWTYARAWLRHEMSCNR